uniref:Olfactory receptor n=1 Tax=Pyxicephalus adspersus TaxID=30357 RepID=A0AAV3B3L2_PYXAD|nr:TPA: hypothetical protein GDO54_005784 [Pyxicephalus adspersus]
MEIKGYQNRTQVTVFEFSGLSDDNELVPILIVFLLLVYVVTILGNLGMISLVYTFSSLHTPMYFFLCSLSLADLFYSSVITPNTLFQLLSLKKSISFFGCALQLYFFCALASTETLLLSTMSYDRYVAICYPFHYNLIMTKKKSFGLIILCYSLCFMQSFAHTCCVFSLPFCGPNLIDHFYCDIPPLLKLSCSNPLHCTMVTGILVVIYGIYTFTTISLSYAFIFLSIFRMTSSNGRLKAFSTCSSHIICLSTFFTTVFFVYLGPHSGVFELQDKMASVFYTTVPPMLNPLIYSLRNQEVKQILIQAIKKSLNRTPPQ